MRPQPNDAPPASSRVPLSTARVRAHAPSEPDPLDAPPSTQREEHSVVTTRREQDICKLLTFVAKSGASDLHLTSGEPAAMRLHGEMQRIKMRALEPTEVRELLESIMGPEERAQFEQTCEADFSYAVPGVARFRVNVFLDRCGVAAVLRTIPSVIPSIESLGLPSVVRSLCDRDSGLVLVTGPTGSGKSTTLAAMIASINATFPGRIITIEDPIEFVHPSLASVVSQRELGSHTRSFANALRAALREDPDVILVGEMRDLDTISLAITAAETGHLVFSTLHSPSASQTIDRIIDVFPHAQQGQVRSQLADCLAGVLTQRLLPKIGGGRVAAIETLVGTAGVRALVRDGKVHQLISMMQVGIKDGMKTMEAALVELLDKGLIRPEDAAPLLPAGRLEQLGRWDVKKLISGV